MKHFQYGITRTTWNTWQLEIYTANGTLLFETEISDRKKNLADTNKRAFVRWIRDTFDDVLNPTNNGVIEH